MPEKIGQKPKKLKKKGIGLYEFFGPSFFIASLIHFPDEYKTNALSIMSRTKGF
ncbi:hypothetical protein AREALGSMS7_01929 [Arenibacter algicola]|jgi:hypothetical protein|uniref:Uncharacterized protein n=1 Tax=Arenibacter algicola TaxID=616991 RepID=A0A221UWY0_9FLAO|nr:hypothetical protein AREALGSMS7_01929 [Arenibacter algicola]MCK0189112.1 hypothetical protein [Arenibacter sp. F20364]|tara:strand:+ start:134 stop:295 length:162 start_codon:yes stop_codon:yes gene_type:complete